MSPVGFVNAPNVPLLKVILFLVKLFVGSDEVNINSMSEFLVVEPVVTVVDAMVMVGGVISKVKVNGVAAVL